MLKILTVTEPAHITLDGGSYLFEAGDKIALSGVASGKTVEDIAKKHGVDVSAIEEQVRIGLEVEKEHTDDEATARLIALDHLWEIPDYYTRLNKMEDEAKKELGLEDEENKEITEGIITEAAVHRRYLRITEKDEDRYFAPSSANDNYMLYFLERLLKSKRFDNGEHKAKVVERVAPGHKHMSLETFLRELIPIPVKK